MDRTWDNDDSTLASWDIQSKETSQSLRDSVVMKTQLVLKLKPLKHSLEKIVGARRQFQKGDVEYFQDNHTQSGTASGMMDVLRVIEGTYARLESRLEELETLIKGLDDHHVSF